MTTTKPQSTTEERPVRCAACGEQMYYEGNVQHEPEIVMTVDFRNGDYSHRNDGGGVFYVHERCFEGFQLRFSDSSVTTASAAPVGEQSPILAFQAWLERWVIDNGRKLTQDEYGIAYAAFIAAHPGEGPKAQVMAAPVVDKGPCIKCGHFSTIDIHNEGQCQVRGQSGFICGCECVFPAAAAATAAPMEQSGGFICSCGRNMELLIAVEGALEYLESDPSLTEISSPLRQAFDAAPQQKHPLPDHYLCIAPEEQKIVINFLRGYGTDEDRKLAQLHLHLCLRCQELAGAVPVEQPRLTKEESQLVIGAMPLQALPASSSARAAAEEIVKAWLWQTHEHDQKRARTSIQQIIERHCH